MSDWRDTFERFHGICNQEETPRMGNPDSELAEALVNAEETLRGENRMSHDSIRTLVAEVKRLRDKWEAPRPHVAHRMPGDPAVLRSCRECYPLPTGSGDRIGAKLDENTKRAWAAVGAEAAALPDKIRPGVPQPGNAPYTPNTDQVRAAYVRAMRNAFIASAGEHEQEFDRWLANVRACAIVAAEDGTIEDDAMAVYRHIRG